MKTNLASLLPVLLALTLAPAGAAVRYVNLANPSPAPPYTTWASAATNIQDAIDAAEAGDEVVVTNGVYQPVVVNLALALRSVNGPEVTVIDGSGINRCAYLRSGAALRGFTLTNGAADQGGGVACESTSTVVSNCVLTGNSAGLYGGGAAGGTLNNCLLAGNSAGRGGGAAFSALNNCVVSGNSAGDGGGVWVGRLLNCTVTGNYANGWGGGVSSDGILISIVRLQNCIVSFNAAREGGDNYSGWAIFDHSCSSPLSAESGNINADPQFVGGDCGVRLRPGSPCIDAGTNIGDDSLTDLDGHPRPLDGDGDGLAAFDMGAYEHYPGSLSTNSPLIITREWIAGNGKLHVSFAPAHSGAYYIMYRGASVGSIDTPVALQLECGLGELIDPTPVITRGKAFYRVRVVPMSQPLDSDNDGIDDVYELAHPRFLNPLNSADAAQDFDGDGRSNLQEYLAGTNPARLRQVIAAGLSYTALLKTNGSLWTLGDGPTTNSSVPVRLGTDDDWSSVAVEQNCCAPGLLAALKRDGILWAWNGSEMARMGTDHGWTVLTGGGSQFALVKAGGTLWTWDGSFSTPPTRIGLDTNWWTVAAGGQHFAALKTDRSLWVWGNNIFGQLGLDSSGSAVDQPTQVGTDLDWVAVAASGTSDSFNPSHTVALKANGSLWAWGNNGCGQFGIGTESDGTNRPVRVGLDTDWAALAIGECNTMARKDDGSLWTWGDNSGGQLGDGTTLRRTSPVRVGTATDWGALAIQGDNFSGDVSPIALQADGGLWSWGRDFSDPSGMTTLLFPQQVGSDTDWGSPP